MVHKLFPMTANPFEVIEGAFLIDAFGFEGLSMQREMWREIHPSIPRRHSVAAIHGFLKG